MAEAEREHPTIKQAKAGAAAEATRPRKAEPVTEPEPDEPPPIRPANAVARYAAGEPGAEAEAVKLLKKCGPLVVGENLYQLTPAGTIAQVPTKYLKRYGVAEVDE